MPKIANKPLEARRKTRNRFTLTISEGTNPANAMISAF
jgi:hypothetical protein